MGQQKPVGNENLRTVSCIQKKPVSCTDNNESGRENQRKVKST